MVNIIKRARKLQQLLWIKCGPGSLIFPKEVTKLRLEFNTKIYGGHQGARKFWREMLPRIKFRNPSLPIAIARHNEPDGPSALHIYTSTSASPDEPAQTLSMRDLDQSEILDALVAATGATPLAPTEQETQEMREVAEFKERSERDRVMVREGLLKERREQMMLKLARGESVGREKAVA